MTNKIPLAYADVELQLSTAISIGDTSFTLSSATDDDGVALPAGLYCFTIDNGTSAKEYLIGQLNGTAVTSVVSTSRQGAETTGAVRAHRVGAPAIITDFATIQRVADVLRGVSTLDGASPISYDLTPTLSDGKQLATVQYVLDVVNGGTVAFDKQVTTSATAGETFSANTLVYFQTSDQEWYKTDADTAATVDGVILGIALGAGTNGVAISNGVQLSGVFTTTGLTAGTTYYAGNAAGALASTPGTTSVMVGVALSTTRLLLIPRLTHVPTANEKAALVGDSATATSSTNPVMTKYSTRMGVRKMTAGATINGGTLPVPVYQNKTDNEFYACDGNDTAAMKFVGFAVSNGTDGTTMDVQFNGVVTGFSALDEGEKYYLSDTAGTISTTPGTYEVLVGRAISTTELLIEKGRRFLTGVGSFTDAGSAGQNQTSSITLGFRPSVIRLFMSGGTTATLLSNGTWRNGTYKCVYSYVNSASGLSGSTSSYIGYAEGGSGSVHWEVTITSVTDTGFTFSATQQLTGPTTVEYTWEAVGEI